MGNNWPLVKLSECAQFQEGYVNPSQKHEEYFGEDVKWLRATDLNNANVYDTSRKLSTLGFQSAGKSAYLFKPDSIAISKSGTIGRVGILKDYMCGNRAVINIQVNNEVANTKFIFYILKYYRPSIEQLAIGSVQPNLYTSALGSLEFYKPNLITQNKIVSILSSLDNKIELNQQTNQTLEKMAQTLFKSWFVDFDPVFDNALAKAAFNLDNLPNEWPEALLQRAKLRLQVLQQNPTLQAQLTQNLSVTSNQQPQDEISQTKNTHQHFPSEFELTDEPSIGINGWIPKGWENIAVNEMVKTVSETYPLKTANKVVFLNTGDILEGKFLHKNYSEPMSLPGQAKKSIKKGDILYSEIRPKNKRFALVNFDGNEHVVSTKLMVLRPNEGFDELFPYFVLTQDKNITILQKAAESRSGTFPQITYTELAMIKVSLPRDRKLMNIFIVQYLKDHFAQKDQRDFQNETLTKLRDTLLPKLISGELQIPDEFKG